MDFTQDDIGDGNFLEDDPSEFGYDASTHPVFTGSAGEYFKIWIVNVVLSIVTLGFYTPWAKVRTRRYFYLNTRVGDDQFDYLADPKRLLYGYLLLLVFLICYNWLPTINPMLVFPVMLVGAIGFPWVLYKSRRFFCHNSAYRNVRLRFMGSLKESYAAYLGFPLLAGMTMWLAMPYALFRQKEYFFSNVSYGGRKSRFSGRPGFFFKVYYSLVAIIVGLIFLMALLVAGLSGPSGDSDLMPMIIVSGFYLLLIPSGFIVQAVVTNYCWNHTEFPDCASFACTIHPGRYAWIELSNAIMTVLSLGLLIPWAKVRTYRYRMECLSVELYPAIDQLIAEHVEQDDGAFGDMAADEFDFEIGL